MNVQFHAKDLTLSDHTKAHLQAALDSFSKYSLDITTANIHLKKINNGVGVEFDLHIAHTSPVVISQEDKNLDAAIDLAIDRANKALRRLHDKVTAHKAKSLKDIELKEI